MGIPAGVARLLLDEARRHPFQGAILELGRMLTWFTDAELAGWAREQGATLHDGPIARSHDPRVARLGCIDDRTFFRRLGFSEVRSCDKVQWEDVDYQFDLNLPVPSELHGRFDAVLESGTIQHVFHLPQVLRNIHDLLKPDGRVIHGMVPTNDHVDHGFYQFSPTLFHDYYRANGYRIEAAYLCEFVPVWYRHRWDSAPWRIYRYEPGCLDRLSYGGIGGRQLTTFFVASRVAGATAGVIPQQGAYEQAWAEETSAAASRLRICDETDSSALEEWLARRQGLERVWRSLRRPWKRLRRRLFAPMPPVVARYAWLGGCLAAASPLS